MRICFLFVSLIVIATYCIEVPGQSSPKKTRPVGITTQITKERPLRYELVRLEFLSEKDVLHIVLKLDTFTGETWTGRGRRLPVAGGLPTASIYPKALYQITSTDLSAYLINRETGKVWVLSFDDVLKGWSPIETPE